MKDRMDKATGELFLGDEPVKKSFTSRGAEILDTTPYELPVGYKTPESMDDKLRRIVREEVSKEARNQGFESFEEADDFGVDGEDEPFSQYELTAMQEERMVPSRSQEGRKRGDGHGKVGDRRKGSEPVSKDDGKAAGSKSDSGSSGGSEGGAQGS